MINTPFGVAISLRLIVVILIGVILWRYTDKNSLILARRRGLIIPVAVLILLALISDLVNSGFGTAFKEFRELAVGLMILIFIPLAVRNLSDLKIICGVAFITITASALIGIMQHYDLLGMQSAVLVWTDSGSLFRVPGMTETNLELSYVLSCALLAFAGVLIFRGIKSGISSLVFFALPVAGLALYFTYTRSALIAAAFGILALVLFLKTRIRGEFAIIGALIICSLLISSPLADQFISGRSESTQTDSTVARQILQQASLNIAADHPVLGIGGDNFYTVSMQYQSSVDSSLIAYEKQQYSDYRTLGRSLPHNDFLNIWVSYGTPALLVYIWIFLVIMRRSYSAFRISSNGFIKGLSVGLAAALIAYLVNAFYHNVMVSLSLFWILGGLSLAVFKLASKNPAAAAGDGSSEGGTL
jgi:putative inorganic carbon (HCO3(-)) transporter